MEFKRIAVRNMAHQYGNSRAMLDYMVLLATSRGDIPNKTHQIKASTRSSKPRVMHG